MAETMSRSGVKRFIHIDIALFTHSKPTKYIFQSDIDPFSDFVFSILFFGTVLCFR